MAQVNQGEPVNQYRGLTKDTRLEPGHQRADAIADVSPLASLATLTYLGLSQNAISDVSPLAGMTSLTALHLYGNAILDVSPLADLRGLTHLFLDSALDVEVLSYIRTEDGFVTAMHDVAADAMAPFFNPGSNRNQRSILRVVNTEAEPAKWTTGGYDDRGSWRRWRVRCWCGRSTPSRSRRKSWKTRTASGTAAASGGCGCAASRGSR